MSQFVTKGRLAWHALSMNEFLKLSGLELAEVIKTKKASPTEIVEAHIARIQEVNPKLNALCEDNFEEARRLAKDATQRVLIEAPENLPLYFGVPFTVKEMFAMSGFKRTGGSIHRKNDVQSYDATVVARMKKAGAIPLCTTNVPELGFWFETSNVIYGRTNNPYDLNRTCGGSSGGEGALIGAGASPMGLGSDIGGSIRMPAGFCGVFGHKPTNRIVPLTGHFPFSREDVAQLLKGSRYPYTSTGPMARKAKDLRAMMQILSGPDEYDQETSKDFQLQPALADVTQLKFLTMEDPIFHGSRRADKEQRQMIRNASRLFQELGSTVEPLDPKMFKHGVAIWLNALKSTKEERYYEILKGNLDDISPLTEMFKLVIGKADYTFPSLVVSLGEKLGLSNKDTADLLGELRKLRMQFEKILGPNTVLLLPLHPRVAPKHHAPLLSPFDFIFTAIFNALGNPATVVPMGLNEQNVPLALQVVAAHGQDHLCLSVAEYLETTFGGWIPPEDL